MKIIREKVEMICYYPKDNRPRPLRFKWNDQVISVSKVQDVKQGKFAGQTVFTYLCDSRSYNRKHIFELKFHPKTMEWELYKYE